MYLLLKNSFDKHPLRGRQGRDNNYPPPKILKISYLQTDFLRNKLFYRALLMSACHHEVGVFVPLLKLKNLPIKSI